MARRRRPRAVSWLGRSRIIMGYAPGRIDEAVIEVTRLAESYAKGRLSKRSYLSKVKNVLKRYGLSEREWKMIYGRIKSKKQV